MYCPVDDPVNKGMIHRQTSYFYIVLTKDTGVIWGLPIDSDQWNLVCFCCLYEGYWSHTRFANWWWSKESREKLLWPIPRCSLITDKSWIDYRSLHQSWPICQLWWAVQFEKLILLFSDKLRGELVNSIDSDQRALTGSFLLFQHFHLSFESQLWISDFFK